MEKKSSLNKEGLRLFITNGMDVVAFYDHTENGEYKVREPHMMGLVQGKGPSPLLQFTPLRKYGDNSEASLNSSMVLDHYLVDQQVLDAFNEFKEKRDAFLRQRESGIKVVKSLKDMQGLKGVQ